MMPIRRATTRIVLLASLLLGAAPSAVHAQFRDDPSAAECRRWLQDLSAGGEAALDVLQFGWVAGCREEAVVPLASAIRSSRAEGDPEFLYALVKEAAQIRDERILDAALEVATANGASEPARAAAIVVLATQFGGDLDYPGVEGAALLTEPLPDEGLCGPGLSPVPRTVENPLPPGSGRRVAAAFDQLALHGPRLLRNLARCARTALGSDIPPQIDVSESSIENRCGTTYRVHNNTPLWLVYQFRVPATGESGDLPIGARLRREFTTRTEGTVELRYDGRLVDTAEPGRACR